MPGVGGLAGVAVTLASAASSAEGDAPLAETRTDAGGAFAFTGVEPGRWVVSSRSDDGLAQGRMVVVVRPGAVARAVLRLEVRLSEAVTVTDARGARLKRETPASVGVVSRELLAETRPSHPSEVMGAVPGVWVNVTGGEGSSDRDPPAADDQPGLLVPRGRDPDSIDRLLQSQRALRDQPARGRWHRGHARAGIGVVRQRRDWRRGQRAHAVVARAVGARRDARSGRIRVPALPHWRQLVARGRRSSLHAEPDGVGGMARCHGLRPAERDGPLGSGAARIADESAGVAEPHRATDRRELGPA